MQVRSFAFAGYRAFAARAPSSQQRPLQQVPLAPVTVLFGKNNGGKSSIGRLLQQTVLALASSGDDPFPMQWRETSYGRSFRDLLYNGESFFFNPLNLDLTVALDGHSPDCRVEAQLICPTPDTSIPEFALFRLDGIEGEGPFSGLLPNTGELTQNIRREAAELLSRSFHIPPLRASVLPTYLVPQDAEIGLDQYPQSELDLALLLFSDAELRARVSAWTEKFLEGWSVDVQHTLDFASLRGRKRGREINLAYSGQGIQQVLPVVTLSAWRAMNRSQRPFLDFIEQPELHLHDAAHAALAELLVDATAGANGMVLVETHSEALILRLRRKIAEGSLPPSHVSLLYVEDDDDGSVIRPIQLRDDGEVDFWPQGVFSESFVEVQGIRAAQRRREQSR